MCRAHAAVAARHGDAIDRRCLQKALGIEVGTAAHASMEIANGLESSLGVNTGITSQYHVLAAVWRHARAATGPPTPGCQLGGAFPAGLPMALPGHSAAGVHFNGGKLSVTAIFATWM